MASLYKRANPAQQMMLRIVAGAVKNAADAHGVALPKSFARSVAKRLAGTLTAQWPEVLAANAPSDQVGSQLLGGLSASRSVPKRAKTAADTFDSAAHDMGAGA